MSWLLDTDVICQPAKRRGDARVVAWLHQERDRCFTSAIVIAQLAYWVRSKEGRQRIELQDWLRRLIDALGGRILGFNVSVAHVWADQEHLLEKHGKRMPVEDEYIAATARRHDQRHLIWLADWDVNGRQNWAPQNAWANTRRSPHDRSRACRVHWSYQPDRTRPQDPPIVFLGGAPDQSGTRWDRQRYRARALAREILGTYMRLSADAFA